MHNNCSFTGYIEVKAECSALTTVFFFKLNYMVRGPTGVPDFYTIVLPQWTFYSLNKRKLNEFIIYIYQINISQRCYIKYPYQIELARLSSWSFPWTSWSLSPLLSVAIWSLFHCNGLDVKILGNFNNIKMSSMARKCEIWR